MAQWAGEGPRLILILGGARSGKSSFAERLALRSGRSVAYIATATAGDADMEERIKRHRAGRPASWLTVEEPLNLARALREAAAGADVLLLDCLTLWLSNWLLRRGDIDDAELADGGEGYSEEVLAVIDDLLIEFARLAPRKVLVVVSNEVGLGIVPAYALGRLYRDILGRINQRLAAAAERVYLMVAGLGVDIKRLHEEAGL
ncbi:MAG: bifunctional adenosylcobinamide kinase/adenosylcobinamide-phosphate guanylyltransferase [Ktedonobacteraceae bacterium]|nr:bifunctional adenosylcobinamide kinase/adenosylcobinamide-phosphate guanylyltransferase [Ktedonobacteraceae bacterium]